MSVTAAVAYVLANASPSFGTLMDTIWVNGLVENGKDAQLSVAMYDGAAIETYAAAEAQHSIQVMVRGNKEKYLAAEQRAMAVWRYLCNQVRNVTVSGIVIDGVTLDPVPIQVIRPRGTINPLPEDELGRPLFSINLEVTQ